MKIFLTCLTLAAMALGGLLLADVEEPGLKFAIIMFCWTAIAVPAGLVLKRVFEGLAVAERDENDY